MNTSMHRGTWDGDDPCDEATMEAYGWAGPGVAALIMILLKVLSLCGVHLH